MPQTMPVPPTEMIHYQERKDVVAWVCYWRSQGGWGFATTDTPPLKVGSKPKTNFFVHSKDFARIADSTGVQKHTLLIFDLLEQRMAVDAAPEASNIRLVK